MSYKLKFLPSARQEWDKLDNSVKQPLLKALARRLENPIVPKDRLHGFVGKECYKIKLRSFGIRLVYALENEVLVLLVIGIGKRENNEIYENIISKHK